MDQDLAAARHVGPSSTRMQYSSVSRKWKEGVVQYTLSGDVLVKYMKSATFVWLPYS